MVRQKPVEKQYEVEMFFKNLWFFLIYFLLLLTIASFGMVAEA